MVEVVYLYAESRFGPTLVVLSDGDRLVINKPLNEVVEDILLKFGSSIEINRKICKDVFKFSRLVPLICSVRNAFYLFVSDKLTADKVYAINPKYIEDIFDEGEEIHIYLKDEILKFKMSRHSLDLQLDRIKQIRAYYSQSYVNLYEYFNEEGIKENKA